MSTGQIALCGLSGIADGIGQLAADLDLQVSSIKDLSELAQSPVGGPPDCLLVSLADPRARELCREARISAEHANLPIVALVNDPWSGEVAQGYALGADDYLPRNNLEQLRNKVMALRTEGAPSAAYLSGKVVVADAERDRRVAMARHLRKMGLEVCFAVDDQLPADPGVKLVVAHCALPEDGAAAALKAFRDGPGARIPWVIAGQRQQLQAMLWELEDEDRISFFDLDSDTAQLAFTANKLLVGKGRSLRRSERIDFETPICVELLQGATRLWGFTYNINLGGLYVRTLTPPALGTEVGLEFGPPFCAQRVRVSGKVVWRQEFSHGQGYPPGFGVQYAEQVSADIERTLEAGYRRLLMDHDMSAEMLTTEVPAVSS